MAEVSELIATAMDEGLYTFDHADIYGGYTTESLFGEALASLGLARESYQLISKCGIEYPGGVKPYALKSYNYSKAYILRSVEESLRNLRTSYLDVLLLHRPSPLMDPYEVAAAFEALRESGKVRAFGVSNFSVSQLELLHGVFPDLITNQVEISINRLEAMEDGRLDQMMMKRMVPTAWSVLGNYFTEQTVQNARIRSVLAHLVTKYEAEENQIFLAFLRKHPSGIIPVVGTSKATTLKTLKKALTLDLEREDWFRLLEASKGKRVL